MKHIANSCRQRQELTAALYVYRDNSVIGTSLLSGAVLTGLSDEAIESIVNNVHHIHGIEDLLTEYVFDFKVARAVLDIIDDMLGEN